MAITDNFYDQRTQDMGKQIAKVFGISAHLAVTDKKLVVGTDKFVVNGVLKQVKTVMPDLGTDTDFTITIKDQDGATVWTSGNIADNSTTYTRITEDLAPLLVSGNNGWYQITVNWTTDNSLSADDIKVLLFLSNH